MLSLAKTTIILLYARVLLSPFLCGSVHVSFCVFSLQTGYIKLLILVSTQEGVRIHIGTRLSLTVFPTLFAV